MKLRQILIATAVVVGSFSSAANAAATFTDTVTNFDSNHGFWINTDSIGDNLMAPILNSTGSFSQTISFTTAVAGNYDFHLETYSNISGLSWALDTNANTGSVSGTAPFYNGQFGNTVFNLGTGNHSLVLTGDFTHDVNNPQSLTGTYYGALTVAAVPEPESYAMLLAGLGLIGMVTRRRNKADVA